jgi:hypothetical protein
VIDSESIKTPEAGRPRGYDAGKKVLGHKRHVRSIPMGPWSSRSTRFCARP